MLTYWRTCSVFMFTIGFWSLWLLAIAGKFSEHFSSLSPSLQCPAVHPAATWPLHFLEAPGYSSE